LHFLVRILFSGLIVFIPSHDKQEVTVLLLNVAHHQHLSDGSPMQKHLPVLLARAGACAGDCPRRDPVLAKYLFRDQSPSAAVDSLEASLLNGVGWILSKSDLAILKGNTNDPDLPALTFAQTRALVNGQPAIIPANALERESFDWLIDLKKLCPDCEISPAVLAAQPSAIVAARFKLRTGKLFTYSIARIGNSVTPAHFSRLDGEGETLPYTQAIATWVGADIEVSGNSVQITDTKFDTGAQRAMTLTPDSNGRVEIAVLNMPPFVPPASSSNNAPQAGKHYEMYYGILQAPPSVETRRVPYAGPAPGAPEYPAVPWHDIHPQTALWSDLLNAIRLNLGRTAYDRLLCPPTVIETP
jgi:hypothetical protein